MEANELRIGNYVEVENYKIIQLENIHKKGTTNGDEQYLISMLKPIELSEEWLKKIKGIKYYSSEYYISVPELKIEIHFVWYIKKWLVEIHNHVIPIVTNIKYVHQLQNLFFDLTGSELELKNEEK